MRRGYPRPRLTVQLSAAGVPAAFWLSDLGPLAQVAAYSIVGIAPVGWLLAESVLLAHACAPAHEPSEKAGGIFAASTAGNVLGALLTTFVLPRFLGTAAAAIVLVGGLFLAAATASLRSTPVAATAALAVFPALDLWIEVTQYVERIEQTLCEAGETRVPVLGAAGMTLGKGGDARWTSRSWTSIRPKSGSTGGSSGCFPARRAVSRQPTRAHSCAATPETGRRSSSTRIRTAGRSPSTCSRPSSTGWRGRGSRTADRCM